MIRRGLPGRVDYPDLQMLDGSEVGVRRECHLA